MTWEYKRLLVCPPSLGDPTEYVEAASMRWVRVGHVDDVLNELGIEGWELVGLFREDIARPRVLYQCILKRAIRREMMVLPAQQPILTVNGLRKLLEVITKPVEWEYRTFEVASSLRENELLAHVNHHAMEGWEPVSVWPSRLIKTGSQIQQWDTETIDILMRRRHPETDENGGE